MRSTIIKSIAVFITILLLTTCKKDNKIHEGYFYTDIENSAEVLYLYVDGTNEGELPNLKTRHAPGNDTLLQKGLHLSLKSGLYKIEGKDIDGNILVSGTLKLKESSLGGSSTRGGQSTSYDGSTFVHKLFY